MTLIEILVATTILGLASVGVFSLLIQALNIYQYDNGRILVNENIRDFTTEMTTNAIYSNYCRVLPDFNTRSRAVGAGTEDAFVANGQSGDFLILVFCNTNNAGRNVIDRIIGYYRTPTDPNDPTSRGPVRRFDRTINPAVDPAVTPIYQILNDNIPTSTANTNPIVLQLAQGLAEGNLFYNFNDQAVMIRGQIIEQGNQRRQAVNTYNFTVSPRG